MSSATAGHPSRRSLSLDEQRAQAIEAWRKMREGRSPPEAEREKTKDLQHPGPKLEGPENEF